MNATATSGGAPMPILEGRGLSKSFKGFRAVNNVTIQVERDKVHAIIGPNGAGKTSLFNLLTKFLEPTEGRILYEGRDITRAKPWDIPALGIIRSFQISAVFPEMTVLDNIRVGLQRTRGLGYQFWLSKSRLNEFNDQCMEFLRQVALDELASQQAGSLPYGQKRALEIATTIAVSPKVMLLDEPTAGMGHESVGLVTDLIREASRGRTVVLVEHNLNVVKNLSDTITVMQRGEVLMEGGYEDVANDPRVIEAYIGGDILEEMADD
jgi:branched-chain amino acid transport system ATP-binding protein